MQDRRHPGAVVSPAGSLEELQDPSGWQAPSKNAGRSAGPRTPSMTCTTSCTRSRGLHFSDKGIDLLEQYIARSARGDRLRDPARHRPSGPLSRLPERHPPGSHGIEKYTPAWLEDVIPWQFMPTSYRQLQEATSVPICTGEDIYLKEGLRAAVQVARHLGDPPRYPHHRRHPRNQEDRRRGAGLRHRHGHPYGRKPRSPRCAARPISPPPPRTSSRSSISSWPVDVPWWDDIVTGFEADRQERLHRAQRQAGPRHRRSQRRVLMACSICSRASPTSGSRPTSGTTTMSWDRTWSRCRGPPGT